jgi:hypothetical protein
MKHVYLLVLAVAAFPRPAGADVEEAITERLADRIVDRVGLHADLGVEGSLLATGSERGVGAAVGVDLVFAVFDDQRRQPRRRLRDRMRDEVLELALGREPPPPPPWPALSRPRVEVHVGGVFDLDGDRRQLRMSAGTRLGVLGIAATGAVEWNDDGHAWAIGPELRLRHRYGPRERSPSIGVVARYDVFVQDRMTHDDRFSLGVFGMFDVF